MDYSFRKVYFLVMLMIVWCDQIHSQETSSRHDTNKTAGQHFGNKKSNENIKWTWQLPLAVKKTFSESQYKDWFVEKIIKYDRSGKIFYRLYVDIGSLLDGDHYGNFLKTDSLDISDNGVIIRN